jgi:hypothetical protein
MASPSALGGKSEQRIVQETYDGYKYTQIFVEAHNKCHKTNKELYDQHRFIQLLEVPQSSQLNFQFEPHRNDGQARILMKRLYDEFHTSTFGKLFALMSKPTFQEKLLQLDMMVAAFVFYVQGMRLMVISDTNKKAIGSEINNNLTVAQRDDIPVPPMKFAFHNVDFFNPYYLSLTRLCFTPLLSQYVISLFDYVPDDILQQPGDRQPYHLTTVTYNYLLKNVADRMKNMNHFSNFSMPKNPYTVYYDGQVMEWAKFTNQTQFAYMYSDDKSRMQEYQDTWKEFTTWNLDDLCNCLTHQSSDIAHEPTLLLRYVRFMILSCIENDYNQPNGSLITLKHDNKTMQLNLFVECLLYNRENEQPAYATLIKEQLQMLMFGDTITNANTNYLKFIFVVEMKHRRKNLIFKKNKIRYVHVIAVRRHDSLYKVHMFSESEDLVQYDAIITTTIGGVTNTKLQQLYVDICGNQNIQDALMLTYRLRDTNINNYVNLGIQFCHQYLLHIMQGKDSPTFYLSTVKRDYIMFLLWRNVFEKAQNNLKAYMTSDIDHTISFTDLLNTEYDLQTEVTNLSLMRLASRFQTARQSHYNVLDRKALLRKGDKFLDLNQSTLLLNHLMMKRTNTYDIDKTVADTIHQEKQMSRLLEKFGFRESTDYNSHAAVIYNFCIYYRLKNQKLEYDLNKIKHSDCCNFKQSNDLFSYLASKP